MLAKTKNALLLGDDEGCFARALWSVRAFGGVLEHPEASHAWRYYGLERPVHSGGWTGEDRYGGRSCCVAQGKYGHRAQKLTWLYGVKINFKELNWGKTPGKARLDRGRTKPRIVTTVKNGTRLKANELEATPIKFRDLLIGLLE